MRLAACLGAGDTVAAALRLVDGGEALAEALSLPTAMRSELWLRTELGQETSLGFVRLAAAGSWRARAALLANELLPSPAFMRISQPLARRGTWGLLLTYLWRPLWLAWHAPRGGLAFARARLRSKRADA
jgi:hypothetical protein